MVLLFKVLFLIYIIVVDFIFVRFIYKRIRMII